MKLDRAPTARRHGNCSRRLVKDASPVWELPDANHHIDKQVSGLKRSRCGKALLGGREDSADGGCDHLSWPTSARTCQSWSAFRTIARECRCGWTLTIDVVVHAADPAAIGTTASWKPIWHGATSHASDGAASPGPDAVVTVADRPKRSSASRPSPNSRRQVPAAVLTVARRQVQVIKFERLRAPQPKTVGYAGQQGLSTSKAICRRPRREHGRANNYRDEHANMPLQPINSADHGPWGA